ncbi:MAG: GNAT family N-acetyltransferase [Thermoplasmatota archaeon]
MAWILRKATAKDLPVLVRHRDAMWIEMGRVGRGEHDPTSVAYGKWLLARMKRGTLTAFVIQDLGPDGKPGEVLASGGVWIQDVQPRPGHPLTMWGYVLSIYTEPQARRRGLARALVDACIEHAREAGCTRACLHASEEGRPLYEELGFERTDEMWLDLRPIEEQPAAKRGARPAKTSGTRRRAGRVGA